MRKLIFAAAMACAIAAPAATSQALSPPVPQHQIVYSIASVSLKSVPGKPGARRLVVTARVNTTGWRDGRLLRVNSAYAPNGVLTFVMVAQPPRGIAGMAFTTVRASKVLTALPPGTHTIVVKSRFGPSKSVSVASLHRPDAPRQMSQR